MKDRSVKVATIKKVRKSYAKKEPVVRYVNEIDLSGTYSYASYMRWKFEERVELIRGRVFEMSAAATMHQVCAGNIFFELKLFLKAKSCRAFISPFDVRFPDKSKADKDIFTVLQPDICVVCDENKIDRRGCVGAPDIVIEVLSPGNNQKDLFHKYQIYEESGVREYWVVEF